MLFEDFENKNGISDSPPFSNHPLSTVEKYTDFSDPPGFS
jgi:hypothetical protein